MPQIRNLNWIENFRNKNSQTQTLFPTKSYFTANCKGEANDEHFQIHFFRREKIEILKNFLCFKMIYYFEISYCIRIILI